MNKEQDDQFQLAEQAAEDLVEMKKWNTMKAAVLNRFGQPIIEAFVVDEEWEGIKNNTLAKFNGFRVIFSKLRTWNPNYE
jgi:hypothetical protein